MKLLEALEARSVWPWELFTGCGVSKGTYEVLWLLSGGA